MAELPLEMCLDCGQPTGRAGKCEDSLYFMDCGPFCPDCWQEGLDGTESQLLQLTAATEQIATLEVEYARVVAQLADADLKWGLQLFQVVGGFTDLETERALLRDTLEKLRDQWGQEREHNRETIASLQKRVEELEGERDRLRDLVVKYGGERDTARRERDAMRVALETVRDEVFDDVQQYAEARLAAIDALTHPTTEPREDGNARKLEARDGEVCDTCGEELHCHEVVVCELCKRLRGEVSDG